MNKKDFETLKGYTESMKLQGDNEDYMEGYINTMIDYKIINTSQADELMKITKKVV